MGNTCPFINEISGPRTKKGPDFQAYWICNLDSPKPAPLTIDFQEFRSTLTWKVWLIIFFLGQTYFPLPLPKVKITLSKLNWAVGSLKAWEKRGWSLMGEGDPKNKNASEFIQSGPQGKTVLVYMPGYYWSCSP